ncbi:MAG TPA: permease [Candidatus Merdisoma faecalis]|uniref:aspartate-alanine antiporter-like transporter n=1 Tax=Lachnoclostridium sp. An138 TaxID=1965560 RepID=UPI000B36A978|nr:permease [Lachnoclostridium sp. An138]OUQ18868.1 permease [Lachnoclostridium sp. An138]HIR97315.1 permease [Candidatus Merdisoma faecalis]
MGVIQWFQENVFSNTLMMVFLIAVIGYLVGSIKICGLELGTAGILLVALVFGHFGVEIPDLVRELGLICFVTSVGFIAGPKFFRNFKSNAASYILLGILVIAAGALVCVAVIKVFGIPTDISVGMMTGALTSTPGLAAALEATGSDAASVGYGIAYPFGVVGVVLFVQLVPKILKVDMAEERAKFEAAAGVEVEEYHKTKKEELFYADSMGFFPFSLAIALGIILAKIEIPLPGGAVFALGTSGGPLIAGLILGHFGHFGRLSVQVEKHVLECLREFGLALFLLGAGSQAGAGFVEILKEHGVMLFLYGALMTLIPMFIGYFFAVKVLHLNLFNTLGSICGGMTSTPALGTLIRVAETDDVASAYAATYPIALVSVVLASQFIGIFL